MVAFFDKIKQHVYNGIQHFPSPMACYQDYFVGMIDAHIVNSYFKEISKNYPADFNKWKFAMGEENLPLLNSVKEDDNSLIIFYRLSSDVL